MTNLFGFEYDEKVIPNKNGSDSRFSIVYGDKGNVIHTRKKNYKIIPTESVSNLAMHFIDEGKDVDTFIQRSGEVIGIVIHYNEKPTKVGDMQLKAVITIPNNGGGRGYLSISETRMICTNGMVRYGTRLKDRSIKIPHDSSYINYIELMKDSISNFEEMLLEIEDQDVRMVNMSLEKSEVMYRLNRWFYDNELTESQKPENYNFDIFRKDVYKGKNFNRYDTLIEAFEREQTYNKELNLPMSQYTVYSSITNYLSRRVERSKSEAPTIIKQQRTYYKVRGILETV